MSREKIAVVMGGPSLEREVSLKSGERVEAALASRDVQARPLSVAHPAEDVEAMQVFAHYGFQPALTLAHMKLDLR